MSLFSGSEFSQSLGNLCFSFRNSIILFRQCPGQQVDAELQLLLLLKSFARFFLGVMPLLFEFGEPQSFFLGPAAHFDLDSSDRLILCAPALFGLLDTF